MSLVEERQAATPRAQPEPAALPPPDRKIWRKTLAYLALALLAALALIPFLWMLSTSLKNLDEVFLFPPKWIPDKLQFHNYSSLWRDFPMSTWIFNSLKVTLSVTIGVVITSSMAAYAFSRINFPGRNILFYVYLAALMIPGWVMLVPNFVLMRKLGWIDTHWALIIPAIGQPFGTFLLRQFFLTIPKELEEAARVDGAGHFQIFTKVILPLAKPALATLFVFQFLAIWNEFLWPLIVLNSPERFTVPLGLGFLNTAHSTDWTRLMAGSMILLVPVVLLFTVAQRYYVRGIAMTGLKG
jgi:multiple sugar transport system permease protein